MATRGNLSGINRAVALALAGAGPVDVADPFDNPGGGAPGDSTVILRRLIERGVTDVAAAPKWDPMAVRLCFMAGEGAKLPLRFGGEPARTSGQPVDVVVTVKKLVRDATQSQPSGPASIGDSAMVDLGGVEKWC